MGGGTLRGYGCGGDQVYKDHKALVHWAAGSFGDDLLLNRWGLKLQEYPVEVEHLAGTENGVADFLSRRVLAQRRNPQRAARQVINGIPRAPADRDE